MVYVQYLLLHLWCQVQILGQGFEVLIHISWCALRENPSLCLSNQPFRPNLPLTFAVGLDFDIVYFIKPTGQLVWQSFTHHQWRGEYFLREFMLNNLDVAI